MLFIVGKGVTELTMGSRQESSICDSLVSAFKISDRLHIHVSSNGCANGIKGEMVFDLSGPGRKPCSVTGTFQTEMTCRGAFWAEG